MSTWGQLWELAGAESDERYERKYTTELSERSLMLQVRGFAAHFREVYAPRVIHNVYYDDPAMNGFWESIDGQRLRVKARVRWYGSSVVDPYLELKLKRGALGRKLRFPLSGDDPFRLEEQALPPLVRAAVAPLKPVLFNRYRRSYFASPHIEVRACIDHRLEFAPVPLWLGRPLERLLRCDVRILEIKYAPVLERDPWFLGGLPFRLNRTSKYVIGIHSLEGRVGFGDDLRQLISAE